MGITGKLGVAIFSVILGFFAYNSKESDISLYTVKRYIYFLVCALFINFTYAILGKISLFGLFEQSFSLKQVIKTSVLLGSKIFPTFWCIRPFFISSILSRLNGKANAGITAIIAEMLFFTIALHEIWISVCLMGNVLAIILGNKRIITVVKKRTVRVAIYLISFVMIQRPESSTTYILYGVSVLLFTIALSQSKYVRAVLEWRPIYMQGRYTMSIYLIHIVVYRIIGYFLFTYFPAHGLGFIFVLVFSWAITVLLSIPTAKLLERITYAFVQVYQRSSPLSLGRNEIV